VLQQARDQLGHLLQLEEQVLRCRDFRAATLARTGNGECPVEADVCRSGATERCDQGCSESKILTPSARREVVEQLVQSKLSITRACQIAGLSRAAYYKRPALASERNAEGIGDLNVIVAKHDRWGLWKRFTRLWHDGHGWNKKRVHRVYCDMGLNLPRRTKQRLPGRPRQPLEATEPHR